MVSELASIRDGYVQRILETKKRLKDPNDLIKQIRQILDEYAGKAYAIGHHQARESVKKNILTNAGLL